MWRFMFITFGFLGFVFFEMSGGSDYEPHKNSIQAHARNSEEPGFAPAPAVKVTSIAQLAQSVVETAPATKLQITLASVTSDEAASLLNRAGAKTERLEPQLAVIEDELTAPESTEPTVLPGAIELFQIMEHKRQAQREARTGASQASVLQDDIRYVTGTVVNMRGGPGTEFDPVGQIIEGMQVSVLEEPGNGWVMLYVMDTGEEGWTADWLVSSAVN